MDRHFEAETPYKGSDDNANRRPGDASGYRRSTSPGRGVLSLQSTANNSEMSAAASYKSIISVAMSSHLEDAGEEPHPEGLTFNEAVTTLIINCIGAGCVLFPAIIADMGLIFGPALCIACAFTLQIAGGMVCSACAIAEELQGQKICTFEALASFSAPSLKIALVITKNFAMLGRIITYMQLVVDSIASFLPGDEPLCKPVVLIRFGIVFPIFSFLAMITNLKQLARVATLGVLGAATLCGCIAVGGVAVMMKKVPDWPTYSLEPRPSIDGDVSVSHLLDTLGKLGKYLAVFLFTFAIIATVPSVRSQMAYPAQMDRALSRTYTYIVIINCIVMFGGYLGFGATAPENIISGEAGIAQEIPSIGVVATISLVVKIIVGTPLFTFVVIAAIEASGDGAWRTPMTLSNITSRIMLMLILNVIGMSLPYLMEGISLSSSVFACFNNILYPVVFHLLVSKKLAHTQQGRLLKVKYIIVTFMGVCLLVFGFRGSLTSVKEKIRKSADNPIVQC